MPVQQSSTLLRASSLKPEFYRILPFVVYMLFLVVDQPLSHVVTSLSMDSQWLYACKVSVVALLLMVFYSQYSELSKPFTMRIEAWLVSGLVGVVVLLLWLLPYPSWATLGGDSAGFIPLKNGAIDYGLVAARIAGAALVVPLMEELFWRSYIMRWLEKSNFMQVEPSKIAIRALLISAAMFALEHDLWLAGLLAGLAYGWLYRRYQNLWSPILAHAVTNGLLGLWVLQTANWQYW